MYKMVTSRNNVCAPIKADTLREWFHDGGG